MNPNGPRVFRMNGHLWVRPTGVTWQDAREPFYRYRPSHWVALALTLVERRGRIPRRW